MTTPDIEPAGYIERECQCEHGPEKHDRERAAILSDGPGTWSGWWLCTYSDEHSCPKCGDQHESECPCIYIDDESVFHPRNPAEARS